jgi:sporulation protein YlmC with PRC-barrel domain
MLTEKIIKTDPDKRHRRVLSASTLTGDAVRNPMGEDLGRIDEIAIDVPSGRVAYAILSTGGFLGLGDKLFAIPWSVLKVDEDNRCFILDADRITLENAPGYERNNWPDMSDTMWGSEVCGYYHTKPYWEETTNRTWRTGRGA